MPIESEPDPQPDRPSSSHPVTEPAQGTAGTVDPRWYDDPRDPDRVWVWDGQHWTPHARDVPTPWYRVAVTVAVSALAVFVWLYAMIK